MACGLVVTTALLGLGILLWKTSAAFRYYAKFISFFLFSCWAATFFIPIMLLRPRSSKNALIPAALLRAFCKVLNLKVTVEGHENIIRNSGGVVLMNHQSMLDLIVLAHLWPIMDDCCVISKKEIFYLQPFGTATWLWGTIFIDRVDPKQAQNAVNKTGKIIRDRQAKVLMFPEGTRGGGKELLPFKKGAFHLALAAKCPIQPVAISRYSSFLGKHRFDSGEIKIRILPKIPIDNYTKDNLPELIDTVYEIMSKNVEAVTSGKSQSNGLSNNNVEINKKSD